MTDDGMRCALKYDCVRWGRHDPPPQAGIGVYERGPDGLLATARVYDDVGRAVEHRSRLSRAAADSARGGTLEFTAGSITGPVAEIVASAVNESPAGQVTVTSVVNVTTMRHACLHWENHAGSGVHGIRATIPNAPPRALSEAPGPVHAASAETQSNKPPVHGHQYFQIHRAEM